MIQQPDDFVVFLCPYCGDTIKWRSPCTSYPSTTHEHGGSVYKMIVVYDSKSGQDNKGKKVLTFPEEYLSTVVKIIRTGLDKLVSEHEMSYFNEIYIVLDRWCDEMKEDLEKEE